MTSSSPYRVRGGRCAVLGGIALLQLLACGGGGDDPDPCPSGDCTIPGSTVVKWKFNHYPELAFESDTCQDLGVFEVRVDVLHTTDPSVFDSKQRQCGEGQATFLGLPPGTYSVAVNPLDEFGSPLTSAAVFGQALAGSPGAPTELTISVPHELWIRSYLGTFLFRLSWAGLSCELATPPVVEQTLTLTAGGAVVTRLTDTGQRVDGTDPQPCRPLGEMFAQFVDMLPFGPATLRVVGTDGVGVVQYERQFETFVGAAMNNPTLTFDTPLPDAGVDAPPDAPPDAPADAPPDTPID